MEEEEQVKLFLRDWSEVITPSGKCVRFSVTIADDTGDPLVTQEGFLLDSRRKVMCPKTRVRFGKMVQFTKVSQKFEIMVREVIAGLPEVLEVLGPMPPEEEEKEAKRLDVGGVEV